MSAMGLWEDEAEGCRPLGSWNSESDAGHTEIEPAPTRKFTENINLPAAFVGAFQVITEP
jgi:hypothetical protein